MKLKICELATGNKFTEKWTFLPKSWQHPVNEELFRFSENFVILDFCKHEKYVDFDDPGKLLILNLVTRQQFWIEKRTIENQIKANAPEEGAPLILDYGNENHLISESHVLYMETSEKRILIEYRIFVGEWEDGTFTGALGSFK